MKLMFLKSSARTRLSPDVAPAQPVLATTSEAVTGVEAPDEPVFNRRTLLIAALLFLVALLLLLSLESRLHLPITGVSGVPYFNEQAESFLHGQWNLNLPATANDIETLHGQQYMYYPPFPALLLLPLVAIFGVSISDILFTTLLSACNLSLLYLLFEQLRANGLSKRVWSEQALIAVFCCFGSINLYLSLGGTVWFTAHIVCMTFTLLSLLAAFRRRYGWSAALLGCAFFSRFPVALGFLFLFYLAWQDAGRQPLLGRFWASLRARQPDWSAVPWRRLLPVAVVLGVVGLLFVARNVIVFGAPLDTGYATLIQQRYPAVKDGLFSLGYVPSNFIDMFLNFPHIIFSGPFDRSPHIDLLNNGNGLSVFATTPLFVLLFWRNQHFSSLRAALWVVVGLDVIAMLLFYNEGWFQFGIRYLYDVYPYAFLLLVLGEARVDWRFALLGALGVIINVLGALQFWMVIVHLGV